MTTKKELSFDAVLSSLFAEGEAPIHLLYRLSDMSDADFKRFQRDWSEVDPERRAALVRHMADIAEENYVVDFTPVFAHLLGDPYPMVRVAALDGLWDCVDTDLVRPILNLLARDPEVSVRTAAARALAHYVLLAEWGQIEHGVAEPIVAALLAEYERPATAPEVKRAALEAIASSDHPRIPELIRDAYEEGSQDMQLSALFAMGGSADRQWLPILEDEMGSPSADFRAEAARAAGAIGSSDSIDTLEQLLDDEDLEVAVAAVLALGQIGGDRAYELLASMADDPAYEELADAIDEALEEMEFPGSDFDLLAFSDDDLNEMDDDDLADDLRAN
jgi:HEAT repeat protein